jgi:ethanolamine permease
MPSESAATATTLQRSALDWRRVSALGIAIAISGNFSGWNYGLAVGGWSSMLIDAVGMALMFFALAQCLAELAAAFPDGAGFDHYVREGFGAGTGWICGLSLAVALAIGTGLAATFSSAYFEALTGLGGWPVKLAIFTVIISLQLRGAREVAGLTVVTGAVVVAVLIGFFFFAATHFSSANLMRAETVSARTTPTSLLACTPFALFLFLGVEQAAQAVAETEDPSRTMPKALGFAVFVAAALGLATLLFATATADVGKLSVSDDPLFTAITAHAGAPAAPIMTHVVSIGALLSLLATFFSLAYAASRQIYHLARVGDLPGVLAATNRRHAPWAAIVVTLACGVFAAGFRADAVMVVFIFLICVSYLLVLGVFIRLRYSIPGKPRPYRALGGPVLAAVGFLLVLAVVASCYQLHPAALSWCIAGLALSLVYHAGRARGGRLMQVQVAGAKQSHDTDDDQVDRDDIVQQPRGHEDQDSRDQRHERSD